MKVVELKNVYKIYKTEYYEVRAIDGISMDVKGRRVRYCHGAFRKRKVNFAEPYRLS